MEIHEISINDIKKYDKNAKKHPEKQVQEIANSIKKFGFQQPLVLDKNMKIAIGHGRFEAAKELGLATVPCVIASELSEEEIKALRLADNKVAESEWDADLLKLELKDISGIDMLNFGFDQLEEIEALDLDEEPPSKNKKKETEGIKCPKCGFVFEA